MAQHGRPKAALDLRYAKVGTLWDDAESWPPAGKSFLNGFTYDQLDNNAPLKAKDRIEWLKRQATRFFCHSLTSSSPPCCG